MIKIIIGALIGALVFYLASGFVTLDFDPNVVTWEESSRFMLVYAAFVGGLLGCWARIGD